MADRFWVGGTGTWNTTSTTNWSASSGGPAGASVPTATDNVFFDQATSYTVTVTGTTLTCLNLVISAGTAILTSNGTITVNGTTTISLGATFAGNSSYSGILNFLGDFTNLGSFNFVNWNYIYFTNITSSGTLSLIDTNGYLYFRGNVDFTTAVTISSRFFHWQQGTAGSKTIKTSGSSLTVAQGIYFDETGSTWSLQDNLSITFSTGVINHSKGNLNLNGFSFTAVNASYTALAGGAVGLMTLTFNGGILSIGSASSTTGGNFTAGTTGWSAVQGTADGQIITYGKGSRTFAGQGKTFPCTLTNSGGGSLTITGANTFVNLNSAGQTSFVFPAATTTTISGTWGINNYASLVSSTPGTQATISIASGIIAMYAASIQDINVTGGSTWSAKSSQDLGNNTGWDFISPLHRLLSTGDFFVDNTCIFDEVTSLTAGIATRTDNTAIYAVEFDEVTINPVVGGVARQILSNSYRIAGIFDEYTGIT